jgi:hypothetical protein
LGGNGRRRHFFYLSLCDGEKGGSRDGSEGNSILSGCVDHVIHAYGIHRLFADIDAGRAYDKDTIVDSILNYIATEGFGEVFERYDSPYRTAQQFRHRYLIEALKRPA